MKLKWYLKGFFILWLTILPISFSSAWFIRQFDLLTTVKTVWWNSTMYSTSSYFRVNNNWTLYTSYQWTSKPVFYTFYDQSGQKRFWLFYWDNNWLPYLYSYAKYSSWELDLQWNFTKYQLCDYISSVPNDTTSNNGPSNCTTCDVWAWFSEFLGNFFSSIVPSDKYYYRTNYWVSSNSYVQSEFNICFSNSSLEQSVCFVANWRAWPNVWGFTNTELVNSVWYLSSLDFASLNISENKPGTTNKVDYYYSTWSCPTVWQLKASSNLTPAVCYAWYDGDLIYTAWENTTIQAWSWLNIFETYDLFSWNMTIQNWYDTYRTYYNNISFNPYPFYNKPKALLGLMVARQTAWLTRWYNWSYSILNYCYYVLNNTPDNQSTCVWSNVSTQYPWITITDQDKQDLVDSINDDYNVHHPWSWSIFLNPSQWLWWWWSSWGDDQCDWIPCLFEKFYQMFTSSRVNDVDFSQWGQGILPWYIALAFVIVVLFYVFKR